MNIKRIIALILALSLCMSLFAVPVSASIEYDGLPWYFWQKIGDFVEDNPNDIENEEDLERYKEYRKLQNMYMTNYRQKNPGSSSFEAFKSFDEAVRAAEIVDNSVLGSMIDGVETFTDGVGKVTQQILDWHEKGVEEVSKLFSNLLVNKRQNNESVGTESFNEQGLCKGSDGQYLTWKKTVNNNYSFGTSWVNGVAYPTCPVGFTLYLHSKTGEIVESAIYCYGIPGSHINEHTGTLGTYRPGVDTPDISLKFNADVNTITVTTYGNDRTGRPLWIRDVGIPWKLNEPDIIEPGVIDFDILDIYKMPTSDPLMPVFYDPVTNEFYDHNKNIIDFRDFEFNLSDDDKELFDDLYSLIDKFMKAMQSGNMSIIQLLTDILNEVRGIENIDYTELLNKINASIITLVENTETIPEDLTSIIELLDEMKEMLKAQQDKEVDYTEKLEEITQALQDSLTKMDVLIALLGINTAFDIFGELTEEESEYMDALASVATKLLSILPTSVIHGAITDLQAIFTNDSPPAPMMVEYRGEEITFLSADMFAESGKMIEMFKIFVSALLIYGWLLVMRRRVSDVFGG